MKPATNPHHIREDGKPTMWPWPIHKATLDKMGKNAAQPHALGDQLHFLTTKAETAAQQNVKTNHAQNWAHATAKPALRQTAG
jgi:hypothetical protein